jgi:methionyl-tRNA synthetase
MEKITFITTPLYYVNDVPHIGHAYTTIAADVLARWKRLKGDAVFFLTGTDEHGAKIAQAAQSTGRSPQAFADHIVAAFQGLWTRLGISHDDFIRTTEDRHKKVVQAVFQALFDKGDIYKGFYEDWYCVSCETFWAEAELASGRCPTCGRTVEKLKEESYFFRLSKYEKPLLEYFEKHPGFLEPRSRASEIVNFVKGGLADLSVSRTKVAWGVPVPFDPGHTVYVWFDALLNYISAPGYAPAAGTGPGRGLRTAVPFDQVWPADVHLVGKEIFRFHTVIWPAMLMALDLPLPRRVFAHGWWTVEGDKMSKSKGNVVDPHRIADEFGVDALRYFVLREVPFGGDGDFSHKSLLNRYNAELANALGNLLNRTLNLVDKNADGQVPPLQGVPTLVSDAGAGRWIREFDGALERLAFHEALERVMGLVNAANKFLDERAPWKTVKTDRPAALHALHEVLRSLKLAAIGLFSFMPHAVPDMWKQLGEPEPIPEGARKLLAQGLMRVAEGQKIGKGTPLFPRKDTAA